MTPGPAIAVETSRGDLEAQNAAATSGPFSRIWNALPSWIWQTKSTRTHESTLSNAAALATQLDTFNSSQANLLSNSTQEAAAATPHVDNPSQASLARTTIIPASENTSNSYQIRLVSFPRGTNPR